jgi:putative ABC transport system permease protein
LEVVGVVRDTRDVRPEDRPQPRLYWHYAFGGAQVIVRTTTPAQSAVPALRDAVAQFGTGVTVRQARPMAEVVSAAVAERRFLAGMISAYAAVALAVAAVGVFGVVAYQASDRTREFGVRAAFGATPATLTRLVLRQAAAVVGAGVGLGIPLALGSGRLLSAHLFDLSPHDPRVMAAVCLLVFMAGLGAGLLPSLRAARVDPMEALRHE